MMDNTTLRVASLTLASLALILGGWQPTQLIGAVVLTAVWLWVIGSRVDVVGGETDAE